MLEVLSNPSAAFYCPGHLSGGVSYFATWEHFFVVPSRVTRSYAEVTWIDPDRVKIRASVPPPAASASASAVPDPDVVEVVAGERSPSPTAQEVAATKELATELVKTLADEGAALEALSKKRGHSAASEGEKGKAVGDIPLVRKKARKSKSPNPSPLRSVRLVPDPQVVLESTEISSLPPVDSGSVDPLAGGEGSRALVTTSGEPYLDQPKRPEGTVPPTDPPAGSALVVHPGADKGKDVIVDVVSSPSPSPSHEKVPSPSGEGFVDTRPKIPSAREIFPDEEVVQVLRRRAPVLPEASEEIYVPDWGIRNSDTLDSPRVGRGIADYAAPPTTALMVEKLPDVQVRDDLNQCLAYALAYASEGCSRWASQIRAAAVWKERYNTRDMELDMVEVQLAEARKVIEERDERIGTLEGNFNELKGAYSSRGKEINKLEAMLLEATSRPVVGEGQMVVSTSEVTGLTSQVDSLKTELSGLQNSLSLRDAEMARLRSVSADRFSQQQREIDALKKEVEDARVGNEALKKEAEDARGAYRWVVEHGLKEFVGKLHRSSEFLAPRTRLCDAARAVGFAEGVREGIRSVPSKTPLSRIRLYDSAAADKYDELLLNESSVQFPYLDALAASAGRSVEELQQVRPESPSME